MGDGPEERLGHYRLAEPIGTGGFSTVYRATDERLDSDVAIKVLADNHALDPDIRERFVAEAQLMRRAANPAIIEIHDVGETDRHQPYIVMTYAAGGDLRRRVARRDVSASREDVRQVVDALWIALDAVHGAGLVHRDVKPDNLLIVSTGGSRRPGALLDAGERLCLGDLGFAKDLVASSGLTVGGGTHGFNAPEQRVGLGTVDARADIYGASAVVFWLLTGTNPPSTPTEQRSALQQSRVDTATIDALTRGLAPRADARFGDIGSWRQALRSATDGVDPESVDGSSLPRSGERPRPTRPARVAALAVALVLGSLATIAGMWLLRSDGATTSIVDGGLTRVEDRNGELRLAVFGPSTAARGDTVTFQAGAQGVESLAWLLPDGTVAPGDPSVDVTFAEPGAAHIMLVGRSPAGDGLSVVFEVTVDD